MERAPGIPTQEEIVDPHTTLDQNAPTTQTRPRGRRLAAAAAGAALVVTMGALPAQAQNAGAAPAETRSADSDPLAHPDAVD